MNKKTKAFVQEHYIAIVSTHDRRMPHGVPVYYIYVEEDNAFYFITKSETKKSTNLKQNKQAALTVVKENPPTVFTADCEAELLDFYSDDYVWIKNKLVEIHSTQDYYPSPISTLKNGEFSLIKLNVKNSNLKAYKKEIDLLSA